ncbi:MAG: 2OG-Fe(II) oxygenase [Myxococcota bacterium]
MLSNIFSELDPNALKAQFQNARPFPFVEIDPFLTPEAATRIANAYPEFDTALSQGRSFDFVNEKRKVQITERDRFPDPVAELNDAIASPEFLELLEEVTGIPKLLADSELAGGGMHLTGAQGRLDVHVDFNFIEERKLHRRLNLLLYLNPVWRNEWGGAVEFWDPKVKTCHHAFRPTMNRCVIFETSEISFHGVEPVTCPEDVARKSFAAYYYTKEPPAGWDGKNHSTVFRARPDERLRGYVLMPLEKLAREGTERAKGGVKSGIKKGIRAAAKGIDTVKRLRKNED